MSESRFELLKRLEQAVPQGPWIAKKGKKHGLIWRESERGGMEAVLNTLYMPQETIEFCVEFRNAAPSLLLALVALEKARDGMKNAISQMERGLVNQGWITVYETLGQLQAMLGKEALR